MTRRQRILLGSLLLALVGAALLAATTAWISWREAFDEEGHEISELARGLAARTERIVLDARRVLSELDKVAAERCSRDHIEAMQAAAMQHPWIKSIGYWQADQRLCATGLSEGTALKPPRADRIYPSGLIAWWPSKNTEVASVQLFLMRFGNHDVAMDPRFFVDIGITDEQAAGLWLEGLRLAANPWNAELPAPAEVPIGVQLNEDRTAIHSHFALGDVVPIDVVVTEPADAFWHRQEQLITTAALVGGVLGIVWLLVVGWLSRQQLSMRGELRRVVSKGQLEAHFQPIIDLKSGDCVGAEALARWRREDGSYVSPEIFIPEAEREGILPDVTLAVVDAILRGLPRLLKIDPGLQINLNLCSEDLQSPDFSRQLAKRIAAAGVPSSALKLEITERALINDDLARRHIQDFRARGHAVAIDDFGTGYSSLAYLETFEIDTLKIDKAFVDAIGADAVTSHVISHIIAMAQSLQLDIVAEGIEFESQAQWLAAQGVQYGQGFHYSKPLTTREFRSYVQNRQDRSQE